MLITHNQLPYSSICYRFGRSHKRPPLSQVMLPIANTTSVTCCFCFFFFAVACRKLIYNTTHNAVYAFYTIWCEAVTILAICNHFYSCLINLCIEWPTSRYGGIRFTVYCTHCVRCCDLKNEIRPCIFLYGLIQSRM